jgi:putative membrane protein
MKLIANIFTAIVMLEHFYILVLEMFLWTSPTGMKAFNLSEEFAKSTASLAANQGLYNGFLAAGILWAFLKKDLDQAFEIKVFFVSCVVVAAVYGAFSVDTMILIKQGAPAIIALIFLILWGK